MVQILSGARPRRPLDPDDQHAAVAGRVDSSEHLSRRWRKRGSDAHKEVVTVEKEVDSGAFFSVKFLFYQCFIASALGFEG